MKWQRIKYWLVATSLLANGAQLWDRLGLLDQIDVEVKVSNARLELLKIYAQPIGGRHE